MRFRFLLLLLAGWPTLPSARAAAPDPASYAGRDSMNGLRLQDYAGFEKDWKLVTVRFRKDSGEQRFIWANPPAWEALEKGGSDYPDGSVFAKIGAMTHDDPAFGSSAVPSGVRRFQLMVRDRKRFQETDGWGYALFDAEGKTFPEEPGLASIACHACHRIVPEKSFVFSEILNLSSTSLLRTAPVAQAAAEARVRFRLVKKAKVPSRLRAELEAEEELLLVDGEMSSALFQGTIDEIRPTLAEEVRRSGKPAALLEAKGWRFSLMKPVRSGTCEKNELALDSVMTGLRRKDPLRRSRICHAAPK